MDHVTVVDLQVHADHRDVVQTQRAANSRVRASRLALATATLHHNTPAVRNTHWMTLATLGSLEDSTKSSIAASPDIELTNIMTVPITVLIWMTLTRP